jgi:hypothetical protein
MMPLLRLVCAIGVVSGLFLAGCNSINLPSGYIKVESPSPYQIKAFSAKGNAFAVRGRSNPGGREANLKYWSEAVAHQKVDIDGYRLLSRDEIEAESGIKGTLFEFETGAGPGRYLYLVALFVSPSRIRTVEAGGPADQLQPDLGEIRKSIRTLR